MKIQARLRVQMRSLLHVKPTAYTRFLERAMGIGPWFEVGKRLIQP